MTKVTGADAQIEDFGDDLCATWSAIQTLEDGFQAYAERTRPSSFVTSITMPQCKLPGEIRLIQHSKKRVMFLC